MSVRAIWIAHAAVRATLVLAIVVLLALCILAPDSAAGTGMDDVLRWTGQSLADLVTAVNPIGIHFLPGGGTVRCFIATQDCVPYRFSWPALPQVHVLSFYLQQGRLWLVAGIALMALVAFGWRRTH